MLIGGEEAGIWSSIKSTFSSATDSGQEQDEGLNIFCLATGHLYERLLKETSQKVVFAGIFSHLASARL